MLLLGVMTPVGIFVILPVVAQHQLHDSVLGLSNSTMLPCDSFTTEPYEAQVINMVQMDSTAPVDVVVHDFEAIFTAYVCNDGFDDCVNPNNATQLGVAKMPKMTLHHGSNAIAATTTLAITCDSAVLLGGIIMPLLSEKPVKMTLSAESVTASVLGLKIKKLKFSKDLNCTYIGQPASPVTSSEYCPHSIAPGEPVFGAVSMKCVPLESSR